MWLLLRVLQEVCELAPTLPARSKIPGVRQGPILASAAARKQPPGTVGQPPGQAREATHGSGSSLPPIQIDSGRDVITLADIRRFRRHNTLVTRPTARAGKLLIVFQPVVSSAQSYLSWF